MHLGYQFVDGLRVQEPHQVKAKPVDMVLVRPVFHGIHNIFPDHGPLRGGIVSTARAVGISAGFVNAGKIPRHDHVKTEIPRALHMVVHHIHDYADPVVVKRLHHLLHFLYPDFPIVRIRGVRAFRHIVVDRIIAPVKLCFVKPGLIHRTIIVGRQQVQVGNPQIFHVVKSRGHAARGLGSRLRQSQEFSHVLDARTFIGGQIPHMQFIDHRVSIVQIRVGVPVGIPPLGIGGSQVYHHGPLAVHARSPGIRIAGFLLFAVDLHRVGVIYPVQIPFFFHVPGSVCIRCHFDLLLQILRIRGPAGIEIHPHRIRGRRPHPESCLLTAPHRPQVAARIGILRLEVLRGINIGHHHLIFASVKGNRILTCQLQGILQSQHILPFLRIFHARYNSLAGSPLYAERSVQSLFDASCHADNYGSVFLIVLCPGYLDAGNGILSVLLGVTLHAGFHINMYRAGNHLRNVDKLVFLDILAPVRGADNESHGRYARSDHLGRHHLSVLVGKRDVIRIAAPDLPEPRGPAFIISVLPVIVHLQDQLLRRPRSHRPRHRQQRRKEQGQGCHKGCHGAPGFPFFRRTT